ncbi:ABC transporter permease, partial [Acidithiobacillus ferridurans]|uniref:ABC transporter permease n=1 Tax=Acidithiobacillus ferridurans TaxID=1232575 RepID=UPI001C06817E
NSLPGHPPVTLLARGMNISDPERELQILHAIKVGPQQPPPVWISEILAGISGWRTGQVIHLPLGGQERAVIIAGIYRDYAYQEGSVSIPIQQYRTWSGDDAVNGVALWLRPGTAIPAAIRKLRQTLPDGGQLLIATPKEIRSKSLQIFNQSFIATYALEAVAMVIGLLGVSSGFGAQTLMRRSEFAILRHLGLRRRDLLTLLFAEGSVLSLLGIFIGGALGMAISIILIEVVNPQSFHWHMGFHPSWRLLLTLSAILWLASTATMVLAGRRAVRHTSAVLRDD